MSKVSYNNAIIRNSGAVDSRKDGQAKRERLISRYRNGKAHQYPMKMHEGPWAEGATANRELMKSAQREAHAIENAAKYPEQASAEMLVKAPSSRRFSPSFPARRTSSLIWQTSSLPCTTPSISGGPASTWSKRKINHQSPMTNHQ